MYEVEAHASAVVACGRTLEMAADKRKVVGRNLSERVEKMRENGLITTEFSEAMNYARLIRNIGAHAAGAKISPQSATGCMRFTLQTLRLLFEVPGELVNLTERPPELPEEEAEERVAQ